MSRRNLPPTHSATAPQMSDHDKSCRIGRTAKPNLTQAEINHLRRLLGWVRCEIGQAPEDYVATLQDVTSMLGHPPLSDDRKDAIRDAHLASHAIPQYVRAAVTALEKLLVKQEGAVIDVPSGEGREPQEPLLGRAQPALSNSANPSGDESLGIESTRRAAYRVEVTGYAGMPVEDLGTYPWYWLALVHAVCFNAMNAPALWARVEEATEGQA